jgi:hypothetical protein
MSDNEIVNERVGVYGPVVDSFTRVAEVWSGILGVHVNPTDVPLCMVGLKLVRTQVTPDYSDNSDDVDGYMEIFRTLVGEDMVHARSTVEYLATKEQMAHPLRRVPFDGKTYDENGSSISSIVEEVVDHQKWIHYDGSACIENDSGERIVVMQDLKHELTIGGLCPNEAHD